MLSCLRLPGERFTKSPMAGPGRYGKHNIWCFDNKDTAERRVKDGCAVSAQQKNLRSSRPHRNPDVRRSAQFEAFAQMLIRAAIISQVLKISIDNPR